MRFEHAPLFVLTSLWITGAGLILGAFYSNHTDSHFYAALILCGLGGCAGFFHLGQKNKTHLTLSGFAHSWLSREILFGNLMVLFLGLYLLFQFSLFLWFASACSALMLLSMGLIYHFPHQTAWNGVFNILAPLSGALCLASAQGHKAGIYCFFTLDLVLFAFRIHQHLRQKSRLMWILTRLTLSALGLALVLMGYGFYFMALVVASDRLLFYQITERKNPKNILLKIKEERMNNALR